MSRLAPAPLLKQARLTADVLAAVRIKLGDRKAATPSRPPRKVDESLTRTWRRAALGLLDACDQAVWAAEESDRFGLAPGKDLLRLSARLRDAALALSRALESKGGPAADALVEAKKHAGEAERLHRGERSKAHDDPRFIDGLKREGVARRLSDAAEGLQKAIDAAAEMLA